MDFVQVVAAVIDDGEGRVLLALRPEDKHQGGLWEFPGGKIDDGESAAAALKRELFEELGIEVDAARPLLRVRHRYPDKSVALDVWRVSRFHGEAHGREGQAVEWVAQSELCERAFPAANASIVSAARLPDRYLVTPEPGEDVDVFLRQLGQALAAGVSLVQLRAKSLAADDYRDLAKKVLPLCHQSGAKLLLNAAPELVTELAADGVHLSSERLAALEARPLPVCAWVAASVHNPQQLAQAQAIGADFAVLSPVQATASHPGVKPVGFNAAKMLLDEVNLPVYFLGGMRLDDLDQAWAHGAQGIAAIRGLWPQT